VALKITTAATTLKLVFIRALPSGGWATNSHSFVTTLVFGLGVLAALTGTHVHPSIAVARCTLCPYLEARNRASKRDILVSGVDTSPLVPPGQSRFGDHDSLDRVVTLVYDELRSIAHRHLLAWRRGRDGGAGRDDSLSTTAVVHEAYLKLGSHTSWRDRSHFLAIASVAMRHVLVDQARARTADKRGGEQRRVTVDDVEIAEDQQAEALLDVDAALTHLAALEPRLARVVECRFYGGLSWKEIAQVLSITPRTAQRDWARARALLRLTLVD
jgi:RNA polymerase sigma factor (TIGR02999 family)